MFLSPMILLNGEICLKRHMTQSCSIIRFQHACQGAVIRVKDKSDMKKGARRPGRYKPSTRGWPKITISRIVMQVLPSSVETEESQILHSFSLAKKRRIRLLRYQEKQIIYAKKDIAKMPSSLLPHSSSPESYNKGKRVHCTASANFK